MSIVLTKGGRVNLSKESGGAAKFAVGLSWDAAAQPNVEFDLDASAFGCAYNASGDPILVAEDFLVFYGNPKLSSPCGGIVHSGDNRTGDGAGDDEVIVIDTSKIDPRVDEISIIVTIYDAAGRNQNFGQVKNPTIRIFNPDDGAEIMKYELDEDFSMDRSVQFGSIYKKDGTWRFNAIGLGCGARTLEDFVHAYGPTLATEGHG